MDTKEKHIRENESLEKRELREEREHMTPDQIAESMPAGGRNHHRRQSSKTSRLWLWLGVLVLIFILLYWLFSIGIFEDLSGYFNG